MAIQIESDLKDILLKIDNKLDNLQTDMTEVKISIVELKKDNQRLEEKIDNTAKNLEAKIDATSKNLEDKINAIDKNLTDNIQNLAKRVDNSEFINRGIFIGLIVTLLGVFAKFLGIIGNP